MTLNELEALADAADVCDHNENPSWYSVDELITGSGVGYMKNARFIVAANPQTIKQLIGLCKMQHRALQDFDKHTKGVMITQTRCQGHEAIAAFDAFQEGK